MARDNCIRNIILFLLLYAAQAVPSSEQLNTPCSNYTVLSEAWRAVQPRGDVLVCDEQRLQSGLWYRLMPPAGNRIPESPPQVHSCGTHAPMWMNSTHPTTYQDAPVQRVLCTHWNSNTCITSTTVHVILCSGGYYVYMAPVVVNNWCNRAWCAENAVIPTMPPPTTTVPPTTDLTTTSLTVNDAPVYEADYSDPLPPVKMSAVECLKGCADELKCTQVCIRKSTVSRFRWSVFDKLLADYVMKRSRW